MYANRVLERRVLCAGAYYDRRGMSLSLYVKAAAQAHIVDI